MQNKTYTRMKNTFSAIEEKTTQLAAESENFDVAFQTILRHCRIENLTSLTKR